MNHEQVVKIDSDYPLAGSVLIPQISSGSSTTLNVTFGINHPSQTARFPAILLIAGSGPTDRDGNPNRSIQLNPYRKLAEALCQMGYVTLRYDKRGCGKSKGKFQQTGLYDLIDDAEAAVRFLKNHPRVDPNRIFLLGHSEGAMIAPAVAQREAVKGLVLLAGTAENLEETMRRQQQQTFAELEVMRGIRGILLRTIVRWSGQKNQLDQLLTRIKSTDRPIIRIMGIIPFNAKWMREHLYFHLLEQLAHVHCPVLAVTGDRDVQVVPQDVIRLAEASAGPAEWQIIAGMNHLMQPFEGNHSMINLIKEYLNNPHQQIHPDLLSCLQTWLVKIQNT